MFNFTIRDLLWLTVVVALGLAWYAEHKRLLAALAEVQQVQELAKEQAERAEGDIRYLLERDRRDNESIGRQLAEFDLELVFSDSQVVFSDKAPVIRKCSQWKSDPFTGRPIPIR
ncbi:MAG TPA: hypothetical protein VMP01_29185 [Pirellulaceae bacterium]|nr:hypothetical protein [Pirellulaceae bacterium]